MFFGHELLSLHPNTLCGKMKTEAQRENSVLLAEIFNRISNMAIIRIDWKGLPESVNERFLNESLYLYGKACFFKDEKFGYIALPCTYGGEFNIYYEPTVVNAFSFNYDKQLNYNDFVFIRQNPTCTPTAITVYTYAKRMADILRTIDVLCKKMKQPFILMCDEKEKMTYLNLIKKITDNEVLILGSKDFSLNKEGIRLLDTRIDTDLTKLWDIYHNYERVLYSALGIDNLAASKRERLLVDEVNANNMSIDLSIEITLKELGAACDRINKKYGLEISVETKTIIEYHEGVGPDGEIYDNPNGNSETRV